LGHHGAGPDHRAGADGTAWKDDGGVPDPHVVADDDQRGAAPREKFLLVPLAGKIGACAIGHMRLRRPRHRMVAGIDARPGRDRAELAEPGVSDLAVVDDESPNATSSRRVRAPPSV